MFRKIMREIVLFIFSSCLILYVLICCLFDFFINLFMGTKTTKLLLLIQKNMDKISVLIAIDHDNIQATHLVETVRSIDQEKAEYILKKLKLGRAEYDK